MNISVNPNSRNKGEADISLLVACKVQLSSEVIKWKTENLRLVKELDKALDRTDNLEGTVTKLVDRTKELEEQLARAEKDNLLLKHRNAARSEEKNVIVQRLSSGIDKYHSFPPSENRSRLSRESLKESSGQPVEDYMQVSQSLLNRMKLEMQQFREMGCQYQLKNEKERSSVKNSASQVDSSLKECCAEDVEKDVTDLISKTQSIKQYLFNQRRKLQTMFSMISAVGEIEVPSDNHKEIPLTSQMANLSTRSNDANADDTFYSCSSPRSREKPVQRECWLFKRPVQREDWVCKQPVQREDWVCKQPVQREITSGVNVSTSTPNGSLELQKGFDEAQCQSKKTNGTDHKICPICEEEFNDKSQKVFEEHVMNHLERESISFLDQYVVI